MTFRIYHLYTTFISLEHCSTVLHNRKWNHIGWMKTHLRRLSTRDLFLRRVQERQRSSGIKVTVVGVGEVGMACAFSIVSQKISTDICLADRKKNKLLGETLDLQHGSLFLNNCKATACVDYKDTEKSRLCIVTAGVRQREGETRLDLVHRNTEVMREIIPNLIKYSPNTILLIASNPVDIMTYVAWKLSGLPSERVLGAGTNLDSSRFRTLLSQRLGVAPSSCHGWIIGEHGDSSVAVWSGVNIAGIPLKEINPKIGTQQDKENWEDLHKQVVESAYHVIKLKGYTSWAIGMTVAAISASILHNVGNLHAVSVMVKGIHGINEEVYLSLPSVVTETGVTDIVVQPLVEAERAALQKSAKILAGVIKELKV